MTACAQLVLSTASQSPCFLPSPFSKVTGHLKAFLEETRGLLRQKAYPDPFVAPRPCPSLLLLHQVRTHLENKVTPSN